MSAKNTHHNQTTRYPLPPEEWDFHEINRWEVNWCIPHEYARECVKQAEQLASLIKPKVLRHATGVGLALEKAINSGQQTELAEWKKKWGKFHLQYETRSRTLRQLFDPQLIIAIETAARFDMDYREPWMTQRDKVLSTIQLANERIENLSLLRLKPILPPSTASSVARLPLNETDSLSSLGWTDRFQNAGVGHYALDVDWDVVEVAGMDKLRLQIMQQLNRMRPPRRVPGRAAEIPYDDLCALAAWRLSKKANLTFEMAMNVVKQRAAELKLNPKKKLPGFPYYESELGWRKAIKKADFLIWRLQRTKRNSD